MVSISSIFLLNSASALQTSFFDSNLQVDLTYPGIIKPEEKFIISSVIQAKTPDNVNVTLTVLPSPVFNLFGKESFNVPEIRQGSTLGFTFELEPIADTTKGAHSVNLMVSYMHKELLGDYTKQAFSKALEIELKSSPEIISSIQSPDSLFAGDKFPIQVGVTNQGLDASDVKVSVIAPSDLQIIGENIHTISKLTGGNSFVFNFDLQVGSDVDKLEKKVLQVQTSYSDEQKDYHESTKTFELLVRPRGFLEIGPSGGVWIGPAFISFIVGIGSIASTAVGVIIFAYHLRQRKNEKMKGERKKP